MLIYIHIYTYMYIYIYIYMYICNERERERERPAAERPSGKRGRSRRIGSRSALLATRHIKTKKQIENELRNVSMWIDFGKRRDGS